MHINKLAEILKTKEMKSKLKLTLFSLIGIFLFTNCAGPMKYQNSMFNNKYFENKIIYFLLSEKSDNIQIVKEGPNRGETKTPNNRETFRKSIEALATETDLNLKYIESDKELSNDEIIIKVDIQSIKWIDIWF